MIHTVVELRTAFHWYCEECAESNFALPEKAELTDDEAEKIYRELNGFAEFQELPENWRDFEVVKIPSQVTCKSCSAVFLTKDEERV